MKRGDGIIEYEGYGGIYTTAREHLDEEQILGITGRISSSEEFEFGELSHVQLRKGKTIVGYVGDDFVTYCRPKGTKRGDYAVIHSKLGALFDSA